MAEPIRILEFGYELPVHWLWVAVVCILLSVASFRFYWRERGRGSKFIRIFLALTRSMLCCLAILALLNWNVTIKKYRRPELIMGLDSSASLQHLDRLESENGSSSSKGKSNDFKPSRINVLRQRLDDVGVGWFDELKDRFQVQTYLLGESTRSLKTETLDDMKSSLIALDSQSKISLGLSQILKRPIGTTPTAIVLFSDGLDSDDLQFTRAIQLAKSRQIPVFPVGLGGQHPAADLQMVSVQCNPKVFLNDLVEFRLSVSADGYSGQQVRLQLIDDDAKEIVSEKSVTITTDRFRDVIRVRVRMLQKGTKRFLARLLPVEGEFDTTNNQKLIQVEVDSDPIRVLLAANYPSREFHFLKQFLGRESKERADLPPEFAINRIELNTFLQQADIEYANVDRHAIKIFPVTRKQLFEYDVVIFCDVKPNWAGNVAGGLGRNELSHLKEFVEEHGGGVVFVAGSMFTPAAYSKSIIRHLFPIDLDSILVPDSEATESESFDQPYSLQKTMYGKRFLPMELGTENDPKEFVELAGPFWFASSAKVRPSAVILANLVSAGKNHPGIVMHKVGLGTVLYHAFPETYRWRFRSSEKYFGRYWSQMIQFLASSKLARGEQSLVLDTDRAQYYREEPIQVFGQLLNRSLINESQIPIVVKNLSGFERQFQLVQSEDSPENYSTSIENLGAGSYEIFQAGNPTVSIKFEILDAGRENLRRPINEAGLKNLALETGGKYFKIDNLDELSDALPNGELIEVGGQPPWVFWNHWEFVSIFGGVFLLLISTEWIVRKRVAMW